MSRSLHIWLATVSLGVMVVSSSACRDDIITAAPVEMPFTMYGVLNPKTNRQVVVVFSIEARLYPRGREALDAVVKSIDLETGETRVWSDSVASDGESGYNHIFWSDFRPSFGRKYILEANRSDGAGSSVIVNVPSHKNTHALHRKITRRLLSGDHHLFPRLFDSDAEGEQCLDFTIPPESVQ